MSELLYEVPSVVSSGSWPLAASEDGTRWRRQSRDAFTILFRASDASRLTTIVDFNASAEIEAGDLVVAGLSGEHQQTILAPVVEQNGRFAAEFQLILPTGWWELYLLDDWLFGSELSGVPVDAVCLSLPLTNVAGQLMWSQLASALPKGDDVRSSIEDILGRS